MENKIIQRRYHEGIRDIGNLYAMRGCYIVMDINGLAVRDSLNRPL